MHTKSPIGRWLVLGLVVLLAHLGLLQSMPLALSTGDSLTSPAMTFATRTIMAAPESAPALVRSETLTVAKPQAPAKRQAAPRPALSAQKSTAAAPESTDAAPAARSGESELTVATQLAMAASAPEPALPPEPKQPAARPPREKAPSFNAAALSGSSKLIYKVLSNKFPFSLNAELLWLNLGDSYSARLSYSAFGQSRTQTSRGQITDAGLAPERFSDKYRSEVAAHFNRTRGLVTFSANTPEAPLLSGAQDRLSVLVQLGALVASEPAHYGPGTTLTIQTIGARDADLWLFTFEATEALELPGGSLQGLKLVRNPRQQYDQKVEVWLAPRLGYLPARIRITEANGEAIDQQWLSSGPIDDKD